MNLSTDSVLFLFLFIFPGAFSKVLNNRFSPKSNKTQKTDYAELSEILASSVVILLINLWLLHFVLVDFSVSPTSIALYICTMLLTTSIFTYAFHYFNKYAVTKGINIYNKLLKKATESEFQTVWDTVFESKQFIDIANSSIVVAIEKDGVLISRGLIASYPAPQTDCNDILLSYCTAIEKIFTEDFSKPVSEKIFGVIDYEYCDFDKGITIKFYNMDAYNAKCV